MSKSNQCILILSCKRPELIDKTLSEIQKMDGIDVVIAIDKANDKNAEGLRFQHQSIQKKYLKRKFLWIFRENNLGIVSNLFLALDEVFVSHDSCVILEDDIQVSTQPLLSMMKILEKPLPGNVMTIGLFGGIPAIKGTSFKNCWRLTPYFSAWGWGIRKSEWMEFREKLIGESWSDIEFPSNHWRKLGQTSKLVWLYRFSKLTINPSFAWDYQFQYYSFKYDKLHLLPVIRANDNVGFEDTRSTNTKSRKPRWYFGSTYFESIQSKLINSTLTRILVNIDSLTWIGDHRIAQNIARLRKRF